MRIGWAAVLGSLVMASFANAESRLAQYPTLGGKPPIVIAHRGASGLRPEHTLEAYALAITQGADAIEPDLVMTQDGVLIARHDRYLSTTTDVAERPEFADRRVTKTDPITGQSRTDWWAEDFTLAEIKTLRAVQPFEGRSTAYDGQFSIPTFIEVLDLIAATKAQTGRTIIVYPELKAPTALAAQGVDPVPVFIETVRSRELDQADSAIFVQCFEPGALERLNAAIDSPLVQLVVPRAWLDPSAPIEPNIPLDQIATYAEGVGAAKDLIVTPSGQPTRFAGQAHGEGLVVHAWTLRDDRPPEDQVDITTEIQRLFRLGVDGVFADFPATAVDAREGPPPLQ
ncbi:MAG: glycerophosphodiester phosphodiesterase family protein [Maricaulaceae bacterium]